MRQIVNVDESDRKWLIKAQTLLTNLRYWISHGQSEHAVQAIDEYWKNWREECQNSASAALSLASTRADHPIPNVPKVVSDL